MSVPEALRKKKGRGFFGIDRETWRSLCDSCSINEVVTYLVFAQGTGGDNRFTSWSATSLKKYAGISWKRAKSAINGLAGKHFLRHVESSTKNKPRYELAPAVEIAAAEFAGQQAWLSTDERLLLAAIREGTAKREAGNSDAFERLADLGQIRLESERSVAIDTPDANSQPDLIWLPNTLVTGTVRGEDSPIRRLRSLGDIETLRLFIDLYHAQNLRDDGGISPRLLRQKYQRRMVGEQGIYRVWAFRPEVPALWFGNCTIPAGVNHLVTQGLLTYVPHLWENESDEAELLHGYGTCEGGEPMEVEMGRAAHRAALAMVPEFKLRDAIAEGFSDLAPVANTFPNVQMVGVPRLRYRPHTTRTGDWYGDLLKNAPVWLQRYRECLENAPREAG